MNNVEHSIRSDRASSADAVAGAETNGDAEPDKPIDPAPDTRHGLMSSLRTTLSRLSDFRTVESAEAVMARHGGAGPGFDTLRIVLALLIMGFHGSQILHGRATADFRQSNLFPVTLALVSLFFV